MSVISDNQTNQPPTMSVIKQFIIDEQKQTSVNHPENIIDTFIDYLVATRHLDVNISINDQPFEIIDAVYTFLGYECY